MMYVYSFFNVDFSKDWNFSIFFIGFYTDEGLRKGAIFILLSAMSKIQDADLEQTLYAEPLKSFGQNGHIWIFNLTQCQTIVYSNEHIFVDIYLSVQSLSLIWQWAPEKPLLHSQVYELT